MYLEHMASRTAPSGPQRRAVLYARISRDRTKEALGVERQLDECRTYAKKMGYQVVAELSDNSISAYDPNALKKRVGYLQMLEMLRTGEADTLVCWEIDRMFRQNRDLENLIGIIESHSDNSGRSRIRVETTRGDQPYDLNDPKDRFAARVLVSVAAMEVETRKDRLKLQKRQAALQGKVLGGGHRPFGYESDRVTVRESEAIWIRWGLEQVVAGRSMRSIVAEFTANNVLTSTGAEWTTHVLRRVLMSGRIVGKVEHQGVIVADAVWPAAVPHDLWKKARRILESPQRITNTQRINNPKLLSGLVVCDLCGHPMRSQPKKNPDGSHQPSYSCRHDPESGMHGCGKMRIRGDWLDAYVTEFVLSKLKLSTTSWVVDDDDPNAARSQQLEAELAEIEAEIKQLIVMLRKQQITDAEYNSERLELLNRKQSVFDTMATIEARRPLAGLRRIADIDEHWDGLDVDQRRAVIAAVVKSIRIKTALKGRNKPDASRIVIT